MNAYMQSDAMERFREKATEYSVTNERVYGGLAKPEAQCRHYLATNS